LELLLLLLLLLPSFVAERFKLTGGKNKGCADPDAGDVVLDALDDGELG
jgi:hypothetical protein